MGGTTLTHAKTVQMSVQHYRTGLCVVFWVFSTSSREVVLCIYRSQYDWLKKREGFRCKVGVGDERELVLQHRTRRGQRICILAFFKTNMHY
jgi:hypothetical protein